MTKIGILGLGSIGARHMANFMALKCDVFGYDPAITPYSNYNDVMDCDGIVIAAPTKAHFGLIEEATACQKPIFVEKPLVLTREEWEEVPLSYITLVGYNLRYHSCVKKARQWLGEGKIGKPLWARFTCAQFNSRDPYHRDGVLLNWSHEIDLALYLLGNSSVECAAIVRENDREVLSDIVMVHDLSGCQTTVHLDYLTRPEQREFLIGGTDGVIKADLVDRFASWTDGNDNTGEGISGMDSFDDNYLEEAKEFLDLVNNKTTAEDMIGCSAHEAHRVADTCLTIKENYE